jgi:hypothetical protein
MKIMMATVSSFFFFFFQLSSSSLSKKYTAHNGMTLFLKEFSQLDRIGAY